MCSLNLFTIELSLVATNDEYFDVKIYLIDPDGNVNFNLRS